MHKRLLPLLLLASAIVPAATANAQERGQTGIAMGYPTNIALIWHASDKLAIRPEVNFVHTSSETETTFLSSASSTDTWNVSIGASALWYVANTDTVRTYVSSRLTYGRSSTDSSNNSGDPITSHNLALSGSFGAQYAPVRKLSVFGEVGYGFTRGSSKFVTPIGTSESIGWAWSPRTAVGVIFYFGRS